MHASSTKKLLISFGTGLIASILVLLSGHVLFAPVIGWDVAGITFLILVWKIIWPLDGEATKSHSQKEDPDATLSDTIILAAALISLAAVGLILSKNTGGDTLSTLFQALLAISSVVISWLVVHTIYTLKYAAMYYSDPEGGVDFNEKRNPDYLDFIYLAFTIGMTFQVSDTALSDRRFRKLTIEHALLSYIFGTVIVATTINLVAGLSK